MAAISVRDLDDNVAAKLRVRAARHGRSMEAEVRQILTEAVSDPERLNLAQALHERFATMGGVDVDIPRRQDLPRAADFADPS